LTAELESAFRIFAAGPELSSIAFARKPKFAKAQRFSGLFESAMDAIL